MSKQMFPDPPAHYKRALVKNLGEIENNESIDIKIPTLKLFGQYYDTKKFNFYGQKTDAIDDFEKLKGDEDEKQNKDLGADNKEFIQNNKNEPLNQKINKSNEIEELRNQVIKLKQNLRYFTDRMTKVKLDDSLLLLRKNLDSIRLLIFSLKRKHTLLKAKDYFENISSSTQKNATLLSSGIDNVKLMMNKIKDISLTEDFKELIK